MWFGERARGERVRIGTGVCLALALASAALPGCTLALGYPAASAERGEAACTNGIDDDLDGPIDCDDPDCVGHCPDESGARCANGVDDDGDGLVDAHDAQCWAEPGTGIAVRRCASVSGSTFAPMLEPSARGWSGDAVIVADPRGGTRYVMATHGAMASLACAEVTTGALLGTTLTASVFLPWGGGVRLVLPLADEHSLAIGAEAISVELIEGMNRVVVYSPTGATWLDPGVLLFGQGWRQLRVEISRGTGGAGDLRVRVEVGPETGARTLLRTTVLTCSAGDGVCVPQTWAPNEALGFGWVGMPGPGGDVLVGDVRLERPAYSPCGYEVPQLAVAGESLRLESVARGGGITCAIVSVADADGAPLGLTAWRSDDDGVSWSGPNVVDAQLHDAAAITHDGEAFVGGAVVRNDAVDRIDSIVALRSLDCVTWSTVPDLIAAGGFAANLRSGALDYAIGPFGEAGAIVHELSFRYGGGDLLTALSPNGAPGSFQAAAGGTGLTILPLIPDLTASGPRAHRHVIRVGRDRVIVFGSGRDLHLTVEQHDGWHTRAVPLLGASRIAGGFDATSVRLGDLVMLERPAAGMPWPARLVYTGDATECATCSVSGTADLFFGATDVPEAGATP